MRSLSQKLVSRGREVIRVLDSHDSSRRALLQKMKSKFETYSLSPQAEFIATPCAHKIDPELDALILKLTK